MKQRASKLPIQVSHPGKLFWAEEGYTKLDLTEFYASSLQQDCGHTISNIIGTAPLCAVEATRSRQVAQGAQKPFLVGARKQLIL